jgi:phosphoglycerate dehydrogenase-like enzyme
VTKEPQTLIYSRNSPQFASWLAAHQLPGTIVTATTAEEAERYLATTEVLLSWHFPDELFAHVPRLRWVQSLGAGVEDLVGNRLPRDVVVTRVVDQFGGPIAEYVFAELLARARELERLRAMQHHREWGHIVPNTLAGKTLGVAGLGSIGREIVRKGRVFDMRVYGLSRSGESAAAVERHFTPDAWDLFLSELDVLVLTLPLTPETESVVNATRLAVMRQNAILVNVGRGRLVVEIDLIHALEDRRLGGAILDVFEREPLPPESPLWTLPGVTVTPHISGPSTVESVGAFFLENMHRYLAGRDLVGVVDCQRGY